jgi:hypothetical protein
MRRIKMPSTHDYLEIMTTEEILKKNVHDLQGQLVHANKRVLALADKLGNILAIQRDLEYHLQGIEIYISDISEMINENK